MCIMPTETQVALLRAQYPAGSRIELERMDDPWTNLKPGDVGTVVGVDDIGQIMMKWDSGSSLSLVPGEDVFRRIFK